MFAEHKCRENWILLAQLGELPPDERERRRARDAVASVEPQEDEQIRWATDTFSGGRPRPRPTPSQPEGMGVIERAAHKVGDALS